MPLPIELIAIGTKSAHGVRSARHQRASMTPEASEEGEPPDEEARAAEQHRQPHDHGIAEYVARHRQQDHQPVGARRLVQGARQAG